MTISSTVRKAGPFDGTGSQTEFPFEFKVFSAGDLYVVQYNEATGVETVLELDSDYTVTLNADQDNDPGGTIELTSALAVNYTLTITSSLANLQPIDLTNRGGFYPSVINDALDRACIQIQQLQDETDRTLKTAVSVPDGVDNTLPMPAANMVIGWDNTGVALKNWSVNDLVTSVAYGSAKADIFTGDGETVDFYLELDPASINNLDVSVGGVCQVPVDDYTWASGTKVTFTTAPPDGETVLIRYMQALPQGTVVWSGVSGRPFVDTVVYINQDTTISTAVNVLEGGRFVIADGKTLTINGPFSCGLFQCFSGAGSVVFGEGVVSEVYPEWFASLSEAVISAPANSIIRLSHNTYSINSTLIIDKTLGFVGASVATRGLANSTIQWDGSDSGTMISVGAGSAAIGTAFQGIKFYTEKNLVTMIDGTATFNLLVDQCLFVATTYTKAIELKETSSGSADGAFWSVIRNNTFANTWVNILAQSNDTRVTGNNFFAELNPLAGAMLYARNVDTLFVESNTFEGNMYSSSYFVDIGIVIGLVFRGNRIENYSGGSAKFDTLLSSSSIIENFFNTPYAYGGDRATSAHNSGQSITEISNTISNRTLSKFIEVSNIEGIFATKNIFKEGSISTDWVFSNCTSTWVETGSKGLRSPVLSLTVPTSGSSSAVSTNNLMGSPEMALAVQNELFVTTVFIVKAKSTNVSNSVVYSDTGDTAEYWSVPKDDKWHVIKTARRMKTTDTQFRPTAFLSYASSYNSADELDIGGIGVFIGTGGFSLPFFTAWTTDPASASNTKAWERGETVQKRSHASGDPFGWVCTAAGTPGTWKGYGEVI